MKNPEQLYSSINGGDNPSQRKFLITKAIFNEHGYYRNDKNFEEFLDKLGEERERLEDFAYFYYYICQPYAGHEEIREELRLVGITSLIEGMMQEVEYKDFFVWFESTYDTVAIENYKETKEKYLEQFGATRKIKTYFEKYILEDDKESLFEYIKPFKKSVGEFVRFVSIGEIAVFLYNMRSEFVHRVKMHYLCPEGCHLACICVGGEGYKVNINIKEFMQIFERSFILFWQKQANPNL